MLELKDVLHIPLNIRNLLSVSIWEEPANRGAYFENHQVVLKNEGTMITRGDKINYRLYRLSFKLGSPPDSLFIPNVICLSASSMSTPWEVWHRQFRHIAYSGLEKLLRLDLVNGFKVDQRSLKPDCIPCIEAKQSETPYGETSNRKTKVGQLMHTNL